jgi:pilus assembly protein CpaF
MFSVIISEKGGAERREAFERTEINVGRVQGNDLILPKGNVSKRHARLLCRDGRFIVTDLKSTNGTYVNGRKIAQATIVREGDKIYIGDFVLRIEAGGAPSQVSASAPAPAPALGEGLYRAQADSIPDAVGHEPSEPPAPNGASRPPPRVPVPTPPGGAFIRERVPVPTPPGGAFIRDVPTPPGGALIRDESSTPAVSDEAAARAKPAASVVRSGADVSHDGAASGPKPRAPSEASRPPAMAPPPLVDPPSSSSHPSSSAAEKALRPPSPRIEPKTGDRHEVISHFPLEHDPDESVHFAVPAPPRVPSQARAVSGKTLPVPGAQQAPGRPPVGPTAPGTSINIPLGDAEPPAPLPPERPTSPSIGLAGLGVPMQGGGRRATIDGGKGYAVEVEARARSGAAPLQGEGRGADPARSIAQRVALGALLERVGEIVDLTPLAGGAAPGDDLRARVEQALGDASSALRGQGDLDVAALVAEGRRELFELGPLTALLEDEDVTEIQVVRHDYVVALHGRRLVPSETGFSGEAAVARVIRRLCLGAGQPLAAGEIFVERRLARGRLFAVLPRAEDHGHMVVIRKPQRADLSLEDLVRSGTISRAMAGLFAQCVAARANILVTGAVGSGTTTLIGALAGAGSTEDRVVVLQEDDELIFNQPHVISILLGDTDAEGARAVQAAARVRPDRLVMGAFAGVKAAELVDAMSAGSDGILAGSHAPTLRQAVLRLTADLAASRPGLVPEVAREQLASVFDLAIEIARLRDGRHRVLRVAELGLEASNATNAVAIRDVFTFTVERTAAGGAIEGSFSPTGVVPAILDDLAARGVPVDASIFRRHAPRQGSEPAESSARPGEPSPRPTAAPGPAPGPVQGTGPSR